MERDVSFADRWVVRAKKWVSDNDAHEHNSAGRSKAKLTSVKAQQNLFVSALAMGRSIHVVT